MEWIVNIVSRPRQRILVKYDPKQEFVFFIGQYKTKSSDFAITQNPTWVDFHTEGFAITPLSTPSLEVTQEMLLRVINEMDKKIKIHEELRETFETVKIIEIREINEI
jgi:Ser-tRNA(Ala) deacylase AlaX